MLSKKLPFGLRLAREGFFKSKYKVKMGAALIERNRLTISWNESKSSPILKKHYKWDTNLHAETSLFPHGETVSNRAMVFIYRATKNGRLAKARPCASCLKLLRTHGVRKITYTITDSWVTERI